MCNGNYKYTEANKYGLLKGVYCNSCLKMKLLELRLEIMSTEEVVQLIRKYELKCIYKIEVNKNKLIINSKYDRKVIEKYGSKVSTIDDILKDL